jgi:hypothetical protein
VRTPNRNSPCKFDTSRRQSVHRDVNEKDVIHVLLGKSNREVLEAAAMEGPTGKQAELYSCRKIRGWGQGPENGVIHYILGDTHRESLKLLH